MAKRDEQRRINTRPEGAAQAASTLVTPSQVIGGSPNAIGGWVFGPASLSNSGIVLHSGGWIQVGIDDYTVRLDALDTEYRMWAGAPLGADAPFSITVDGSLHAENAYIEGEIVADTGAIGGFEIGADYIRDAANSMGLASTVTGGDDVRFWAGDTFANRAAAPFRVTEAGLLTVEGATIEGALTATTGELVNLDVTGSLILSDAGLIKSANYATGVSGWQVEQDGSAEFQDVLVRGTLHSVVFQANTVSTVAGSLRVEPDPVATVLTTQLVVPAVAGTTSLEVVLVYPVWEVNDEVMLVDEDNAIQGTLVIQAILASGALVTYLVRNDGDATPADTFQVGSLAYKVGTEPGYLLITANPILKGPRYAVVDSAGGVDTLVGVLGNMDGAFGVVGKAYGIGIGDFANDNYLRYEPTDGFVLRAGGGALTVDEDGVRLAGCATGSPATWLEYIGANSGLSLGGLGMGEAAGAAWSTLQVSGPNATYPDALLEILAAPYSAMADDPYARIRLSHEGGQQTSVIDLQAFTLNITGFGMSDSLTDVNLNGTIRESVPIHMRLTRRTTGQTIPTATWTPRYLNTIEYANAGSGIAGDDLLWMHTPLVFVGTGLDDLTHLGLATYPESFTTQFQVKITATGTPDSFQYSMDNGATWNGSNIAITGASQTIGGTKDVRIQFGATTGHTLNDLWDWNEHPRYLVVANKAGLYEVVAATYFAGTVGTTLPYRIQTSIRKNGTLYQTDQVVVQAQSEQSVDIMVSGLVWLDEGDYVDCPIYQNSGVSKDTGAATDAYQHWNGVTIARIA